MNKIFRTLAVLSAILALTACDNRFEFSSPLRLQSDYLELPAEPGSTPIIVYANSAWQCAVKDECDWARLKKNTGTGLDQAILEWDANEGFERNMDIVFESEGTKITLGVRQQSPSEN